MDPTDGAFLLAGVYGRLMCGTKRSDRPQLPSSVSSLSGPAHDQLFHSHIRTRLVDATSLAILRLSITQGCLLEAVRLNPGDAACLHRTTLNRSATRMLVLSCSWYDKASMSGCVQDLQAHDPRPAYSAYLGFFQRIQEWASR